MLIYLSFWLQTLQIKVLVFRLPGELVGKSPGRSALAGCNFYDAIFIWACSRRLGVG